MTTHRNLVDCCVHGYWHCRHCDRIADHIPEDAEGAQRCGHCHKVQVIWEPPVFNNYEKNTVAPLLAGAGRR